METERLTAEHRAQIGVNHVILELMRVAKQIGSFRGIQREVLDDQRGLGCGVVRGDPKSAPRLLSLGRSIRKATRED
jgi:hypothetical protein